MPEITLRNITKRWGKFYGVDHLNLDIADNSFITLLGPYCNQRQNIVGS